MHRIAYTAAGAALALSPAVQGAVILTDDTTAPTANVILANASNASFLRVVPNANGTTADEGRGQTFTLPDAGPTATAWNVSELTLQKNGTQTTGANSKLYLWVFEYNPSNNGNAATPWINGDGTSDNDPLDGTSTSAPLVNKAEMAIGGKSYADGRYLHFTFSTPLVMDEGKAYGFYLEYTGSIASAVAPASTTRLQLSSPNNLASSYSGGQLIYTTPTANSVNIDQDFSFHLVGTAVPEPACATVLAAASIGLLARRRRG